MLPRVSKFGSFGSSSLLHMSFKIAHCTSIKICCKNFTLVPCLFWLPGFQLLRYYKCSCQKPWRSAPDIWMTTRCFRRYIWIFPYTEQFSREKAKKFTFSSKPWQFVLTLKCSRQTIASSIQILLFNRGHSCVHKAYMAQYSQARSSGFRILCFYNSVMWVCFLHVSFLKYNSIVSLKGELLILGACAGRG